MELLLPATDRPSSSLSRMVLYAEHPFHPVHAALFTNYDGTWTLSLCARAMASEGLAYRVALSRPGCPFARSVVLTPRPAPGRGTSDRITFDDCGDAYNAIHFIDTSRCQVPGFC